MSRKAKPDHSNKNVKQPASLAELERKLEQQAYAGDVDRFNATLSEIEMFKLRSMHSCFIRS